MEMHCRQTRPQNVTNMWSIKKSELHMRTDQFYNYLFFIAVNKNTLST